MGAWKFHNPEIPEEDWHTQTYVWQIDDEELVQLLDTPVEGMNNQPIGSLMPDYTGG
jgi:hypothetical protein